MEKQASTPEEIQDATSTALKHWFDEARFRQMSGLLAELHDGFNPQVFLSLALPGLDDLSLIQRLRRLTECTHAALGLEYLESLKVLMNLAPKIDHHFVTLFLPDYVGLYGRDHYDESMKALKFFTRFGSSEFAVREFLKIDLKRGLNWMLKWSRDKDEHVRRLASEGCRPRLPWSFRLQELIQDPSAVLPILENLKTDESLYVRKSVANHLNDITKDHPEWVLQVIQRWGLDHLHTAWIAKRALRTLIKKGNKQALSLFGAGDPAKVKVVSFEAIPPKLRLGESLHLSLELLSTGRSPQHLVLDYVVHYIKKANNTSAKVFKWKELNLPAGERLKLAKTQRIQNFSTRIHHPGKHGVDLMVNGEIVAQTQFVLEV